MALLINKQNLKKSDGTDLPSSNVLVKFIFQSQFEGLNQKFFFNYYVSPELKNEGYSPIQIKYPSNQLDEEGNVIGIIYNDLINDFIKELDNQIISEYDLFVDNLFPNSTTSFKTIYAYHLFIKEKLEEILGEGTVEIRLDIQ